MARRIGASLYREPSAISAETVDALAAVMVRLEALHDPELELLVEEFGRASVTDMAETHLLGLTKARVDELTTEAISTRKRLGATPEV